MTNNFYNQLPEWIKGTLKKRSCSQCKTKYTKKDIVAIGIRQLDNRNYAIYLEHQCSNCGFRGLTVMGKHKEDSLEKLCYIILESIKKRKIAKKSKIIQKHLSDNPISDQEVKELHEFMKNSKTHEDFLREIGVIFPKKDTNNDSS